VSGTAAGTPGSRDVEKKPEVHRSVTRFFFVSTVSAREKIGLARSVQKYPKKSGCIEKISKNG
jgi:hypothetical protein